ncbi:MAG TPA: urease subunit gamma [Nitrososphaeraceae archaeon]|nr:urease subunit gamma [Nitrososphaeraceae archaeon]
MIQIKIQFKGESDIPPSYLCFEYRDKIDEITFYNVVNMIKGKLSRNLKINLYETLLIYSSSIIDQLRSKKPIIDIQKNAKKLLLSDNVMIGVPNMLGRTIFQVKLDNDDHFTEVLFEKPLDIDQYILATTDH